jgi:hypothetical protein
MNTDTYTKTILTVIAVCLVWLCIKDVELIPSAHAQEAAAAPRAPIKVEVVNAEKQAVKVEIVEAGRDFEDYVPVIIRAIDIKESDADGVVPVKIHEIENGIRNRLPVSGQ